MIYNNFLETKVNSSLFLQIYLHDQKFDILKNSLIKIHSVLKAAFVVISEIQLKVTIIKLK